MATIKQMNRFLTDYLIPKGSKEREHIAYKIGFEFHNDWSMLMLAVTKAVGSGKKKKGMHDDTFWYAVYPNVELTNREKWIWETTSYSCAFTKSGFAKMGYGKKFNKDFEKKINDTSDSLFVVSIH